MSYNILVTGGAGFIGSHLVDELVRKGNSVTIVDNLEPQVHKDIPEYLNSSARLIRKDIREKKELLEIIKNSEIIFHDAAMVGVGQSMYQVEKYTDVNVLGTAKLLDLLANEEHDVKKLVVASSMSIYGEGKYECNSCGIFYPKLRPDSQLKKRKWEVKCPSCGKIARSLPTDEDKPLFPTSIYAITKRDQEEMCLSVGKAYGIPTVALRYFNVYGPRQSLSNPYTGVCAIFSSRIRNNKTPLIFEDGLQTRDFVDVRDIVQANLLAIKKSRANYNAYNVGTGIATSILDVAEVLIKLYGACLKPDIVNKYRAGDIRHCYANISKIKKLGFKPRIKFEEGMKFLVKWGESQLAEDRFEEAQKELKNRGLME